MNKIAKKNVFIVLFCVMLSLVFGVSCLVPTKNAKAEETISSTTISTTWDNFFSVSMQATPRANETIDVQQAEVVDNLGKNRTYWRLNWSEVERLIFVINLTNTNDALTFTTFSLTSTFVQTDDMQTPLSPQPDKEKPIETPLISSKTISANSIVNHNFYYYIDSTAVEGQTENAASGQDFGLYKFTLSYNYIKTNSANPEGQESSNHLDIYVAVMPTEIDEDFVYEINRADVQILHKVSSANLMNQYELWLSSSELFRYVNPRYIKWEVVGTDAKRNQYVLDKNQRGEGGEKTIYDGGSPNPPYGSSFVFNSNGIEGLWDVTCKVEDQEGHTLFSVGVKNLSTYRVEPKSNLWWIILIAVSCLVVIGLIILITILIMKKHSRVW